VVAAVAFVAGGAPAVAAIAAVSMTALQLGIGVLNDVVDAPADAGRKPGKPIPAGLVAAAPARWLAIDLFMCGVVLAASVSIVVGAVSVIVVGVGLAYDLRLKGSAWSWLPFAVGIPLLPVYGWLAARGSLPGFFAILLPTAVVAGAALAIGNALVDVERDLAAGQTSVALALGERRAPWVVVLLVGVVWLVAVVSSVSRGPVAAVGVGLLALPAVLAGLLARRSDPALRERAWQTEAVSIGATAVAWLLAVTS
jgi:4-hydroxybenzoate polyprenyltransferase